MAQTELNTNTELHTESLQETPIMEEGLDSGGLLTINGTLFFVAISFIVFTIVMQKIFYGPMANIRKKRSDYIKGIKTEAEQAFNETERLKNEYASKIAEARNKVAVKTNTLIREANQEKTTILEEKQKDISEFLDVKRNEIKEEQQKTFDSIKESISSYAFDISKKILNEEIPIAGVTSKTINDALNR